MTVACRNLAIAALEGYGQTGRRSYALARQLLREDLPRQLTTGAADSNPERHFGD
jgi:hypothetical protein